MKDIDFDELDRAVSSVLGQNNSKEVVKPADEPVAHEDKPDDVSGSVDSGSTVTADDTLPSEEEPVVQTVSKTTPLAIKRRGKFMDVMHPSADMSSATAPAAPSVRPARTSPIVSPLLTEHVPEASVTDENHAPVADLDESATLIGAEPVPADNELDEPSDQNSNETTESHEEKVLQDEVVESQSDDIPESSHDPMTTTDQADTDSSQAVEGEAEPNETQSTPFLTDTQVEKRPLGAFGETDASDASQPGDVTDEIETPELMPAAAPAALPRELQPDVVTVESVQEAEAEQAAAISGDTSVANPFAAKVGVAPEATDGRVDGHPLFDTSTYHEPIAAVHAGGFPTWAKWALGLLCCLVVGAGVGYFLFTAGL